MNIVILINSLKEASLLVRFFRIPCPISKYLHVTDLIGACLHDIALKHIKSLHLQYVRFLEILYQFVYK